jgi:tetratricopeptide (TPR) repeat protein
MPRIFLRLGYLAVIFMIGSAPFETHAGSYPQTEEEFARLPPYCRARLKGTPEERKLWESRLGGSCFLHIHHYCAALNDVNIAMMAKTKKERDASLEYSMAGGFDYMWNQAGTSCGMMPEILLNKGKTLLMLNKGPEAAMTFQKAIEINRRYIPAYLALADLYKRTGQIDSARKLLDYALTIDPKSKPVQSRLAELGSPGKSRDSSDAATRDTK